MNLARSLRQAVMPLAASFPKLLTAACVAAAVSISTGCSKPGSADSGGTPTTGSSSKPVTVGYLYVGTKDDYGYNQAHAQGAAEVKKLPGVKVVEAEQIKEDESCEQTMEAMVKQQGATLIFATSFGYFDPHVKKVAAKFPDVTFLHAGGTVKDGDPSNVGTYFAYIDELEYLCGMVAGKASKSNKLGYIAAKPITPVLRDINAFELGAKSVNPAATTTVIFTGDWFQPSVEANAVNTLADQGIDVVTGHIDSPKAMIQQADKRGIFVCGYHANGADLAPTHYLTGAEWDWAPMNKTFVTDYQAGKDKPKNFTGSLKDGSVKLSPYGPMVTDETKKAVEAIKAQMVAGTFKMFKGPLKDNKGNEVIPAGKEIEDQAGELWGMKYLVEGVNGSTGS